MKINFLNEEYNILEARKDGLIIEAYNQELFIPYEVLNESKSEAPLYRVLGPRGTVSALKTNEFDRRTSYGICFTRDKNYWIGDLDGVTKGTKLFQFRINQYKLASDYKIITIAENGYQRKNQRSESEERILDTVKNINRYIECIDTRAGYLKKHVNAFNRAIKKYNDNIDMYQAGKGEKITKLNLTENSLKTLQDYMTPNTYSYMKAVAVILDHKIPLGDNFYAELSKAKITNNLIKFVAPSVTSDFKELEAKIKDIQAKIPEQPSADAHQNSPLVDLYLQNIDDYIAKFEQEGFKCSRVTDLNTTITTYCDTNINFVDGEAKITATLTPSDLVVSVNAYNLRDAKEITKALSYNYTCYQKTGECLFTVPIDISKFNAIMLVFEIIIDTVKLITPSYHEPLLEGGFTFDKPNLTYKYKDNVLKVYINARNGKTTVKILQGIPNLESYVAKDKIKAFMEAYSLSFKDFGEYSSHSAPNNINEFITDLEDLSNFLSSLALVEDKDVKTVLNVLESKGFKVNEKYLTAYRIVDEIEWNIKVDPSNLNLNVSIMHRYGVIDMKDYTPLQKVSFYSQLEFNDKKAFTTIKYDKSVFNEIAQSLLLDMFAVTDALNDAKKSNNALIYPILDFLKQSNFKVTFDDLENKGNAEGVVNEIPVKIRFLSNKARFRIDKNITKVSNNIDMLASLPYVKFSEMSDYCFIIADLSNFTKFYNVLLGLVSSSGAPAPNSLDALYANSIKFLRNYGFQLTDEGDFYSLDGCMNGLCFDVSLDNTEIFMSISNKYENYLKDIYANLEKVPWVELQPKSSYLAIYVKGKDDEFFSVLHVIEAVTKDIDKTSKSLSGFDSMLDDAKNQIIEDAKKVFNQYGFTVKVSSALVLAVGELGKVRVECTANMQNEVCQVALRKADCVDIESTIIKDLAMMKNVTYIKGDSLHSFKLESVKLMSHFLKIASIKLKEASKPKLNSDALIDLFLEKGFTINKIGRAVKKLKLVTLDIGGITFDGPLSVILIFDESILASDTDTHLAFSAFSTLSSTYFGTQQSDGYILEVPKTSNDLNNVLGVVQSFNDAFADKISPSKTPIVFDAKVKQFLSSQGFTVNDTKANKLEGSIIDIDIIVNDTGEIVYDLTFVGKSSDTEAHFEKAQNLFIPIGKKYNGDFTGTGVQLASSNSYEAIVEILGFIYNFVDNHSSDFDDVPEIEDEPKPAEKPKAVKKLKPSGKSQPVVAHKPVEVGKRFVVEKGQVATEVVPFAPGQVYQVTKTIKALFAGEPDTYETYKIEILSIFKNGKVRCKNLDLGYEFKIAPTPAGARKSYTLIKDAETSKKPKPSKKSQAVKEPQVEVPQAVEEPAKVRKGDLINKVFDLKFKKTGDPDHDDAIDRILAYVKKNQKALKSRADVGVWLLDNPKELNKYKLQFPSVMLMFYESDKFDVKKDPIFMKFYKCKALSIIRQPFKTKDLNGNPCIAVCFYDAKTASKYKLKLIEECLENDEYLEINGISYKVIAINEGTVSLESSMGIIFEAVIDSLML